MKATHWFPGLSAFILGISIVIGYFAPTQSQLQSIFAESVVLVNSTSPEYFEYTRYIQPYLDHFGIPYFVVDISTSHLPSELQNYALIIIGHDQLDTGNIYLTVNDQQLISDAVNQGVGLVNFDSELADANNQPYYQYVQNIYGFGYTQASAATNVRINSIPSIGNYVIAAQSSNAVYTLSHSITPEGVILPQQNSAVLATVGDQPLLVADTYGQGKAIQWTSYAWLTVDVWGFFHGFDDLVWRSLVWAARKPFIMQGMPPFVTMRVDDVTGPLWWLTTATGLGFKPWLGVFINDIDSAEAAQLSTLTNNSQADVSIHSFNTSSYFYWNSSYKQLTQNFNIGTQWHQNNNIPISAYVVPHYYQISTYSFKGLSNWGVKCIGTLMEPGRNYGDPWLKIGPFHKYEDGISSSNLPFYYADRINVPGYPEFDGQFFDLITEPRDIRYDWVNNPDLNTAINLATNLVKRSLDSMAVATFFTHEYNITSITNERWQSVLQGLVNNIATYNPIYVDMDYACNYARAVHSSSISASYYDPTSQSLETTLVGSSDIPTVFYLFSEVDGEIGSVFVDVPAFTGSVTVPYSLQQPIPTATLTPSPSPTATDTPTVTNTSLPTDTYTPTSTPTDTATPTATFTPTSTPTATNTSTATSTDTPTQTPTETATATATNTATSTDTPTQTPTETATATNTATSTSTITPSPTGTSIPSATSTATATDTPTSTTTSTPTASSTPTATNTSTVTATATASSTATPTITPSPTNTSIPTATPTATQTSTPTNTPPPVLIFADGFESGDLSAWSAKRTGAGGLSVSSSAAIVGNFGLKVLLDRNDPLYVQDNNPNNENHYRVSFYLGSNSLSLANGQSIVLVRGSGISTVFQLNLNSIGNAYRLVVSAIDDAGTWHSGELGINAFPNFIEIDWKAATSDGANDGYVVLRINGAQQITVPGLNNDTLRIDSIRLGALAGVKNSNIGTLYFDDFHSYR